MSGAPRRPRSVRRLFGPDHAADVRDELEFHLAAKVDDLVARGWTPDDARREAERQLGDRRSLQRIGEHIGGTMNRRQRLGDYRRECLQDLHFAGRAFARERGFALVAVLVLALAIGANVATFSVINTLILRPLPFPDASQLVWIAPPPSACARAKTFASAA